jgi:predicted transcriptional regulator
MPEPKGNDVRTLAVRVSPDFHAQLSMVAKVDEMSLVDLMMQALENHVAARREAPDFQAKVQHALEEAEAQMQRTRAMLLGTLPDAASTTEAGVDAPATGRARRKDEASG